MSFSPLVEGLAILVVLILSAIGARSTVWWMARLVAQRRAQESAGGLTAKLKAEDGPVDVNELALELKRAAGAIKGSGRRFDEVVEQFIESIAQAQEARDPYAAGHSERTSQMSTAIAEAMGLSPSEVEIIRIGAKLHDIGKIGVPDAVLCKPGKLTSDERALIQRHPQIGKEILEKVGWFRDFLPIVELHHENPDGSGYPYGLRKDQIPLPVRIVHVADVFDAITNERAYRPAMTQEHAWKLMVDGIGTLFDPEVVEALWTVLRREPGPRPPGKIIVPHENDLAIYTLPVRTF
jgi:putative nucleotidyltransferase with HDIG domain